MLGWAFKIQGPDGALAQTVCVAIPDKDMAQNCALKKVEGMIVSEEPLSEITLRLLELKPFQSKIL